VAELDRYIPGVPCWVDTSHPDPEAAVEFYGGLFGWEFQSRMPSDTRQRYFVARLPGGDVAAVGSMPDGSAGQARWNTYVWVDSADATAAKVRDAGGSVLADPFDVADAGRMAAVADPEGAAFCLWQANRHRGAQVVNAPGSLNFTGLATRDAEGAKAFYGAVFGWTTLALDAGEMWTLPGYGDFLERINPGTYAQQEALDAPAGFADVVASLQPVGAGDAPPHWSVTFAVDDADAVAQTASALGGNVVVAPMDVPWSRMTIIVDPQGAAFIASQFVPGNRDVRWDPDRDRRR
jgi:predicted enzyme related to lactoylglutathione lyase